MNNIIDVENEFDKIKWSSPIGVFLEKNGRHIGLVAINEDETGLNFIHLAGEDDLCFDQFQSQLGFLVYPGLEREREMNIAAFCRKVWKKNNGAIPYGFSYPNGALDKKTGEFLIGSTKLGLTCASFVLAVFHSCGIPLVALGTWPRFDSDDMDTQNFILDYMKKHGALTYTEFEERKREIGNSRVRPSEVAALAAFKPFPHTFRMLYSKAEMFFTKIGVSNADFIQRKAAACNWLLEFGGRVWCKLRKS